MANEFAKAGARLVADLGSALEHGAHEVMAVSDILVPKDTETLRESAEVFPVRTEAGRLVVEFGYGFGSFRLKANRVIRHWFVGNFDFRRCAERGIKTGVEIESAGGCCRSGGCFHGWRHIFFLTGRLPGIVLLSANRALRRTGFFPLPDAPGVVREL